MIVTIFILACLLAWTLGVAHGTRRERVRRETGRRGYITTWGRS